MCGIFGIITKLTNHPIYERTLNSLIQLQNRGYDSSGIGMLVDNKFVVEKFASTNEKTSVELLKQVSKSYSSVNSHSRFKKYTPISAA